MRITAQLIDALNGPHLRADRFEGPLDDGFEHKDKVASSQGGLDGLVGEGTSLFAGPASTTVCKIVGWPSRPWVGSCTGGLLRGCGDI